MDAVQSAQRGNESANADAPHRGGSPRAAVILGNDAVVAARPAPAAELSRGCTAAGFDIVIPPSWGDELVAQGYLAELANCRDDVAVACSCPRVASLLAASATHTPVRKISVAAPPVAAARYLRLVYGEALLVTYVGDCPSANDASINARFTPAGFFASLHRQGITLDASATTAMDDADSERWRRHRSVPGGLPALRFLARPPVDRLLRDVDAASVDPLAWQSSRSRVLLDLTSAAGCSCGGNRSRIEETEPARSVRPVLVPPPGLNLQVDADVSPSRGGARARRPVHSGVPPAVRPQNAGGPSRLPGAVKTVDVPTAPVPHPSSVGEAMRTEADAAEHLARVPSDSPSARAGAGVTRGADVAPRSGDAPGARSDRTQPTLRQPAADQTLEPSALRLVAIPAIVLAIAAALGIAVYLASATPAASDAAPGRARSARSADTVPRHATAETAPAVSTRDSTVRAVITPSESPDARSRQAPGSSGADSARATSTPGTSGTVNPGAPPRRARVRAIPQVVPGWLPQGQKAWTPADSVARVRRDSSTVPPRRDTVPEA